MAPVDENGKCLDDDEEDVCFDGDTGEPIVWGEGDDDDDEVDDEEAKDVVGWISLCNGDFVLKPPYEKLLEKAWAVVNAGIGEGLLDADDVNAGEDPSISFCVNHWIGRLEEAGLHMPKEEVDGGPGMSDIFFDIRVSDASDKRALTAAIEDYIDLVETRLDDLREAKEAEKDDESEE